MWKGGMCWENAQELQKTVVSVYFHKRTPPPHVTAVSKGRHTSWFAIEYIYI